MAPRRTIARLARLVMPAAAVAAALALPSAAHAATRCPATFQVLHDDRIGAMRLPAGPYAISVTNVGCGRAAGLFSAFLEDYDGVLPFPWTSNARQRSFTDGRRSFSVRPGRPEPPAPPSPPTPSTPTVCPASFTVLHDDRIGAVRLPRGAYRTSLLSGGLTCAQVSQLFARFLAFPSGNLPPPWTIAPSGGTRAGAVFDSGPQGRSFGVEAIGSRTAGGGTSNGTPCGAFRVRADDHVGSLFVPRGTYDVILPLGSTLSCVRATEALTRFLAVETVPRPWILDGATGTFTRGARSTAAFRIEPVAGRVG